MQVITTIFLLACLALCASAHMQMSNPFPIRSPLNKNQKGPKDYSYTSPLSPDGHDFPCKGFANDPFQPTADYNPGQEYELSLQGSATHGGGSCQISLSYDQGKSFKVIHSIMGGCPITKSYKFNIPEDAPPGQALLAWSWFNKIGNREMYMNCAQVNIHGGKKRSHARDLSPVLDARAGPSFQKAPDMFIANVNGPGKCKTEESQEVTFPLPGDSVEGKGSGKGYKCDGPAPFLGPQKREDEAEEAADNDEASGNFTPAAKRSASPTPSSHHHARAHAAATPSPSSSSGPHVHARSSAPASSQHHARSQSAATPSSQHHARSPSAATPSSSPGSRFHARSANAAATPSSTP